MVGDEHLSMADSWKLRQEFWPGPLSIVGPARQHPRNKQNALHKSGPLQSGCLDKLAAAKNAAHGTCMRSLLGKETDVNQRMAGMTQNG